MQVRTFSVASADCAPVPGEHGPCPSCPQFSFAAAGVDMLTAVGSLGGIDRGKNVLSLLFFCNFPKLF